jgi:lysophospholipase L1-like esterase
MEEKGNAAIYAAKQAKKNPASPLRGKTIYWLGSSVTLGLFSYEESMPDYLFYEDGLLFKKDAISGTNLRQKEAGDDSYYSRLLNGKILDPNAKIDAFICQLSTNDAWEPSLWGEITPADCQEASLMNPKTTLGAIESIILYVRKTWDCPLYFYTGSFYEDINGKNYALLVKKLQIMAHKYNVPLIDLFSDEAFNRALPLDKETLMHDGIHPFRAGYELWWTPYFESFLLSHLFQ